MINMIMMLLNVGYIGIPYLSLRCTITKSTIELALSMCLAWHFTSASPKSCAALALGSSTESLLPIA